MRGCTHLVNTCTFDIDLIPMYFVVQHCGMSGGLRTQRAPAFLSDPRSSGFPPGSPRHGAPRPERPATRATQRSCQPCPQASLVPPPPARAAPSARGAGDRLRSGAGPSRATRRRNSHPLRRLAEAAALGSWHKLRILGQQGPPSPRRAGRRAGQDPTSPPRAGESAGLRSSNLASEEWWPGLSVSCRIARQRLAAVPSNSYITACFRFLPASFPCMTSSSACCVLFKHLLGQHLLGLIAFAWPNTERLKMWAAALEVQHPLALKVLSQNLQTAIFAPPFS